MKRSAVKAAVALFVFLAAGSIQTWAASSDYGPGVVGQWKDDEDGRWWYENPDGSYPKSEWKRIKDQWYYFDGEGYMKTGWVTVEGKNYYLQQDGAMFHGAALTIDGIEYQFLEDGSAVAPVKQPTVDLETEQPADNSEMRQQVDAMADQILSQITTAEMSKRQKANAIYDWVRGHMKYVNHSEKGDWVKAAYDGLRKKKGDCYTYYAVSLALLTRADIESIEVVRTDGHHWWNLINCGDGWYHFDTTPRAKNNRKFFMWTDAQLDAYNQISGGTHTRDKSLYPATPEV